MKIAYSIWPATRRLPQQENGSVWRVKRSLRSTGAHPPVLFFIRTLPLLLTALLAFCCASLPHPASGSDGTSAPSAATASPTESPSIDWISTSSGLNGTWKVGFTTPHQLQFKALEAGRYRAELETVDGDGVRVVYGSADWTVELAAGEEKKLTILAKHGRANHPIQVRLYACGEAPAPDQLLIDRTLNETERGTVLNSAQPWVVGIGNQGMMLDSAMLRSARTNLSDYTYTELAAAEQLPSQSQAYSGVDLLVFSSSNTQLIERLSAEQAESVQRWVMQGGRCWLTLGQGAKAWFQHDAFQRLVPGPLVEVAEQCNPGPLESFLNSQARLAPLVSAIVALPDSSIELTGQQQDRTRYPLLARWSVGAGKIRFIATNIDSNEMKDWESQVALVRLMLSDGWEGRGMQQRALSLSEDLSLQLSQTLDRFAGLRMSSLGQLSSFLVILLAILGPLDYFLVAKKWKKPRATWGTLVATSLLACVGLALLQKEWKPTESSLNTLEIVDVDAATQTLTGRSYSHFYGGPRGTYEVRNKTMRGAIGGERAVQLDWLGQPGGGLGGFDSTFASDQILPLYRIEQEVRELDNQPQIERIGIPEAGTQGFVSHWNGTLQGSQSFGQLASHSGAIDLLDGELRNPFGVEVLNGILIYRGRFYTLPLRFKPEDTMSVNATVVPKDFTRRLQRRINIDGKDQGTPWDRNESDLSRIAEMLSFHRVAAGSTYTGMIDRYLSALDLSDLMKSERAILFGEIEAPQVQWDVSRNTKPLEVHEGVRSTMIRVMLPVATPTHRQPPPQISPISSGSN